MSACLVDLTSAPLSLVEQSALLSYLALSARRPQTVNWTSTTTGNVLTHQIMLENQQVYAGYNDFIMQGAAYYPTWNNASATYQTGEDVIVRAQFINSGALANTFDANFCAVSDHWQVFAFAHNLGTISSTANQPVIYVVGHVRDPAIEYIAPGGAFLDESVHFWSVYSSAAEMIATFINLTGIWCYGITISRNSDGSWNSDDILMFSKGLECGNKPIMTLSYTQKPGDKSLITNYIKLLTPWTGYLVDEALRSVYDMRSPESTLWSPF
ncbi:hypothetical protein BS17DRAFT_814525 [Gyrodon lividus]|nr:hypothetical protein BS17DRAFT_814525 [Gyrodon lividus]